MLIRWLPKEKKFEGFMLKGSEAKSAVRNAEKRQEEKIQSTGRRVVFPAIHVGGKWEKVGNHWKCKWETWNLAGADRGTPNWKVCPGSPERRNVAHRNLTTPTEPRLQFAAKSA